MMAAVHTEASLVVGSVGVVDVRIENRASESLLFRLQCQVTTLSTAPCVVPHVHLALHGIHDQIEEVLGMVRVGREQRRHADGLQWGVRLSWTGGNSGARTSRIRHAAEMT